MNIPMPRASIGDHIVAQNTFRENQILIVEEVKLNECNRWIYTCRGTERPYVDEEININISTQTDYQEKEETVKCFHPDVLRRNVLTPYSLN